jgi:methylated-DNA-[protein]-cysteine S-methyltransferase
MYARDTARLATPIGLVVLTGTEEALEQVTILPEGAPEAGSAAAVRLAVEQVELYFAGELDRFDLPLAPARTPRGEMLRAAIVAVGHGETETYGLLAARIGSSARAVGQACARNTLPLVVPCHRILTTAGADRYSAGEGPVTKQWLLAHERRTRRVV